MLEKLRGLWLAVKSFFSPREIEQISGIKGMVSSAMNERITLWQAMMCGQAAWNEQSPSCGVLNHIASRLNMLVSREITLEVKNRAIEPVMKHLNSCVNEVVDYIALLGGCIVRPLFANGRLQYEIIPLGKYIPVQYDFDGTLLSAIIVRQLEDGKKQWILTEKHSYKGGTHHVTVQLYKLVGDSAGSYREVPLSDCPQTMDFTREYEWHDVKQPMIVEFRNQHINTVDGSLVPVPIICGCENLIKDCDQQYARMMWEQEAGEMRLFVDSDMFTKRVRRDGSITTVKPTGSLSRLVTMVDGDGSTDNKRIFQHSPQLRTNDQAAAFQQVLRRLELACGLGKGTISDLDSVQQTATQYTGGRQELYAIVDKIEAEIEIKYHCVATIFAHIACAYGLGSNDSTISIVWNEDATRKDLVQAKQMELQEITAGVRNKWEYRKDFMGEDENTARANVPEEKAPLADPFGLV